MLLPPPKQYINAVLRNIKSKCRVCTLTRALPMGNRRRRSEFLVPRMGSFNRHRVPPPGTLAPEYASGKFSFHSCSIAAAIKRAKVLIFAEIKNKSARHLRAACWIMPYQRSPNGHVSPLGLSAFLSPCSSLWRYGCLNKTPYLLGLTNRKWYRFQYRRNTENKRSPLR